MAREKEDYRANLEILNSRYPDHSRDFYSAGKFYCPFKTPPFKESVAHQKIKHKRGGDIVPETIVNILESIKEAKGQEYVEGLVDMANLLAPRKTEDQPN